jgi:phosphoribosylamine--glycine ligase
MPRGWERWPFDGKPGENFERLAGRVREAGADLVVVGPDNPLADGLVDTLERYGCLAFGPRQAAARIEASKAFAKEVMKAAGVPTARYFVASSLDEARAILAGIEWGQGWVVKADGLALGKGVRVCASREEALGACEELIRLSPELVIEGRLSGEELSCLALCDGTRCAVLEPARDYKRVGEGDQGPNTGGMGAFSPVPGVPAGFVERLRREVFEPTLRELKRRGAEFRGVLYAGVMADFARDRYGILEFNARFGDPETQALLPRIEGDLYPWFEACARGDLSALPPAVPFARETAVYVVGAARGYPRPDGQPEGYFCAGVAEQGGKLVTAGGRVLGALGVAATLEQARAQAYRRLDAVGFEGMHYRRDIAQGGVR